MKSKKLLIVLVAALALFGLASPSPAGLNAVDPGVGVPPTYEAAYGFFPKWYQDTFGRGLELCLSSAEIAPDAGRGLAGGPACTLLANPGIFDPAFPICFPGQCTGVELPAGQTFNFPDESFWFMADATIAVGGVDITYVSNLEAAFGGGDPAENEQISFARIRIRIDLPIDAPAGSYTLIHPYGVEVFNIPADGGGTRVINMTRDIGIGAPGDFTGALNGDIGPFLMDASVPTLGLIPSSTGELFIGDPNTPRPVVGSPFGTNFVRLEGPTGFAPVQTNLFTVMGKVFAGQLATPLIIERSSYSRTNPAAPVAQQDVFAKAPPTSEPLTFQDANGVSNSMTDGDTNGNWFGQSANNPTLPATVSVTATNSANNNTTVTKSSALVDLVIISRAEYNFDTQTLVVEATSSDEVNLPTLTVSGQAMTLVGTGPVKTATITGLSIPPARIIVTSANGGSDTEEVVLLLMAARKWTVLVGKKVDR